MKNGKRKIPHQNAYETKLSEKLRKNSREICLDGLESEEWKKEDPTEVYERKKSKKPRKPPMRVESCMKV